MKGLCNHNHTAPATVPGAEEEELLLPFFISSNNHPYTGQKGIPFQELKPSKIITQPTYSFIELNNIVESLSLAGA